MVAFQSMPHSESNHGSTRRPVVPVDRELDDLVIRARRALEEAQQSEMHVAERLARANAIHAWTEQNNAEIAALRADMGQQGAVINTEIVARSAPSVAPTLLPAETRRQTLENQQSDLEPEHLLRDNVASHSPSNVASNPPPNAALARFRMQLLRTLGAWVTILGLSTVVFLMTNPQFAWSLGGVGILALFASLALFVIFTVALCFISMRSLRNIHSDTQNHPEARISQHNSYQILCNLFRPNLVANGTGTMPVVNSDMRPA